MKVSLLTRIFIGLIVGILAGLVIGPAVAVVKPLGDLFLRLIMMIVVPLVFTSLVVGAASTGDIKKLGRIGGKTMTYYLLTTAFAVTIGLILANLAGVGRGLNLELGKAAVEAKKVPPIMETLLNIIPTNPVAAMSSANMLQIIVFALFIGIAITLVGEKAKPAMSFFESFAELMYRITGMVMSFAPIGVFGLVAPIVGKYGADVLLPLIKVILVVYIGCILHAVVTYSSLVYIFSRMSPLNFFKGFFPAMAVAFSTSSSSGTLPVTMRAAEERLGVSKRVSSFVLPLGATINMDGTALYQGVCTLFIAQIYGIDLSFGQQLQVILAATLASVGTAGVPGAGLIMLTMVLQSVGLPLEGIALIAGVDRILDMMRTTINVTGDAAGAVIVAATEGELDTAAVTGGKAAAF